MGTKDQGEGYKQLLAWKRADDLALAVFRLAGLLAQNHRWLASQAARAAVSVPANIAEGYCRGSIRDYLRFLNIARGSLGELEYYIHFMDRTGLIDRAEREQLEQLRAEAASLLFLLIRSLRAKLEAQATASPRTLREEAEIPYDPLSLTPCPHDPLTH